MFRWNDKYGIKFMRLSSEMFPFASHAEYGYKLAPFASEALAEAGKVVAELGHRVSTHPGQFTQLGSPRPEVIENAYVIWNTTTKCSHCSNSQSNKIEMQ
jgi:UV DNA damage endonuclease